MRTVFAGIRHWLSAPFGRRRSGVEATGQGIPACLSTDAQWARMVAILDCAAQRTAAAASSHALALEKLQAADYALDRMLDGLAGVMEIRPRMQSAAISSFPARPVDIRRRRLAA